MMEEDTKITNTKIMEETVVSVTFYFLLLLYLREILTPHVISDGHGHHDHDKPDKPDHGTS